MIIGLIFGFGCSALGIAGILKGINEKDSTDKLGSILVGLFCIGVGIMFFYFVSNN